MTFFDHEPDLTMKTETCLEIQAYLDGELDSRRQKEAAALCDRDPEARALHASLENLRGVLQSHEPVHLVPDSREFYWSQIQKRIAAAERTAVATNVRPLAHWAQVFRWLIPVGGLAVVALIFVPGNDSRTPLEPGAAFASSPTSASTIEYRSDTDGVTVHWIN